MGASIILPTRSIFFFSITAALFGCERYAVTLNQQPVYTPPPLYHGFAVADQALMDCIKQTIMDNKVVRVEQLTSLTCRHAGVKSLTGLQHFTFIQQLDLSHNRLKDVQVLTQLPQLKAVKIQDNTELKCDTLAELTQTGVNVTAPTHCLGYSGD